MSGDVFLYPSVTSLPGQTGPGSADRSRQKPDAEPGEFERVFRESLVEDSSKSLGEIRAPLKFSAHATQRMRERKIQLDPQTLLRVNDAIDKADAKGVQDTLVLTSDAALIVSVKNRTVITALDREGMSGNVFSNIDGAVIV